MCYLEDMLAQSEQEAAQARYKRPNVSSHYNPAQYQQSGSPPGQPAAANRSLPNYGTDMKIHEKDPQYVGEEKRGVEYTTLQERVIKYKVSIAGLMTRGAAGELLDTRSIKQEAKQKHGEAVFSASIAPHGAAHTPKLDALVDEWSDRALIWVCVPVDLKDARQSVFYSNVCRPGAFHHSSLGAGREVLGAGEWIAEAGKLKKISANSGHYQPSLDSLHQCVVALGPALQPDTTVLLWNKQTGEWEDVPVNSFTRDPSGSGKYKSHWSVT